MPAGAAIDGAIVWRHRDQAGIRFLQPLHPSLVAFLAFRGRPAAAPWATRALPPVCEAARHAAGA